MKNSDLLEYLGTYISALELIDSKSLLLSSADSSQIEYQKKIDKTNKKFKGFNLIIMYILCSLVCLAPMGILNYMIETDLNLIVITPIISAIILFLYKTKSKPKQNNQIKMFSDSYNRYHRDYISLVGEINFTRNFAEETMAKILILKPNEDFDLTNCDKDYLNIAFLKLVYGYIKTNPGSQIQQTIDKIKNFTKANNEELQKEYTEAALIAEYRQGIIKHCEKLKATDVDKK